MKILLDYDQATGTMTDANGAIVGTWAGAKGFEMEPTVSVRDLVKMKDAGFTAEDIVELKNSGVLTA